MKRKFNFPFEHLKKQKAKNKKNGDNQITKYQKDHLPMDFFTAVGTQLPLSL